MQIIQGTSFNSHIIERSVVTIGNFDGVHLGHAELLKRVVNEAFSLGICSLVVTFEPHPLAVLAPDKAPIMITTLPQKLALMEEYGINYAVVIPFTLEFSQLSAEEFVYSILCHSFGMKHLVIGHDYAFGRQRQGNFTLLESMGKLADFTVEDVLPVGDGQRIFSSSEVRRAVNEGELPKAASMLGRYHLISGVVVRGEHRGTLLGYPTANIETENQLLPPDGVYAVWVTVNGQHFKGACNIGKNLTFGATNRTIEVFMLDSPGNSIYGCQLALHFVHRLRDGIKFINGETLKSAIANDVEQTEKILAESGQSLIHPGYFVDARNMTP